MLSLMVTKSPNIDLILSKKLGMNTRFSKGSLSSSIFQVELHLIKEKIVPNKICAKFTRITYEIET